jgi:hypothetical protein
MADDFLFEQGPWDDAAWFGYSHADVVPTTPKTIVPSPPCMIVERLSAFHEAVQDSLGAVATREGQEHRLSPCTAMWPVFFPLTSTNMRLSGCNVLLKKRIGGAPPRKIQYGVLLTLTASDWWRRVVGVV